MTSAVSMPAGHEMVAADFDAYENLTAARVFYQPVWASSGTQPAIGNGTFFGLYRQMGKHVFAFISLTMGSTTTFGTGTYTFTLPVTAIGSYGAIGAAYILDSGTANRSAICWNITTTTVQLVSSADGDVGATVPQTFAVSDIILANILYEAA